MPTVGTFRRCRSPLFAAALACAVFAGVVLGGGSLWAAPLTEQATDEAVKGSLGGWSGPAWFDGETGSVKPIPGTLEPLPPPPDLSQLSVQGPPAPTTTRTAPNWSWLGDLWEFLIVYAPWLLLLILVIVLAVLLGRAYIVRFAAPPPVERRVEKPKGRTEIERLENLPFQVARSQDDLLGEARRQYEGGNYSEAIIYLFSYELVQLDRHQKLRLERGKTNRQYLRELRAHGSLANILRGTMYPFEDVFFGHHQLERVEFEACWQRLGEFEREVVL